MKEEEHENDSEAWALCCANFTTPEVSLGDQMWFGLEPDLLIPSFNKYLVSVSTMYQALGYIAQKTKMINTHG